MDTSTTVTGQQLASSLRQYAQQVEQDYERSRNLEEELIASEKTVEDWKRRSAMPADKVLDDLRLTIEEEMEDRAEAAENALIVAEAVNTSLEERVKEMEATCLRLELDSKEGLAGLTKFDHKLLLTVLDDPRTISEDSHYEYPTNGWSKDEIKAVIQGAWLSGDNFDEEYPLEEQLESSYVGGYRVVSYLRYRMGIVDKKLVAELLGSKGSKKDTLNSFHKLLTDELKSMYDYYDEPENEAVFDTSKWNKHSRLAFAEWLAETDSETWVSTKLAEQYLPVELRYDTVEAYLNSL